MIQELAEKLRSRFPDATLELERPVGNGTTWWLDFVLGSHRAEIAWNPAHGFGLSVDPKVVFGQQFGEAYRSADAVVERITELVGKSK